MVFFWRIQRKEKKRKEDRFCFKNTKVLLLLFCSRKEKKTKFLEEDEVFEPEEEPEEEQEEEEDQKKNKGPEEGPEEEPEEGEDQKKDKKKNQKKKKTRRRTRRRTTLLVVSC